MLIRLLRSSCLVPRTSVATLVGVLIALATASSGWALTATFEDLGLDPTSPGAFLDPSTSGGSFVSGGVTFLNDGSFVGFSASTTSDTTTAGFANQFSNITGAGAGGSSAFGVAFGQAELQFATSQTVLGAEFTNTTYAALSMLNGDPFAKRFGGATGNDPDYLRLSIEGLDGVGGTTGVVELFLADYRFADNALDYVVDEWTHVDLTVLGVVSGLRFNIDGSDIGPFGLNTPAYFAIDNLATIPEPGTALLLGLGLAALARGRHAIARTEEAA